MNQHKLDRVYKQNKDKILAKISELKDFDSETMDLEDYFALECKLITLQAELDQNEKAYEFYCNLIAEDKI